MDKSTHNICIAYKQLVIFITKMSTHYSTQRRTDLLIIMCIYILPLNTTQDQLTSDFLFLPASII